MSSNREELLKIYNHFGQEKQLEKLREEVEELIEAIKEGDEEHIKEEMADVLVIVNQIRYKKEMNEEELVEIFEQKVNRTLERIESKYYEQEEEKCK